MRSFNRVLCLVLVGILVAGTTPAAVAAGRPGCDAAAPSAFDTGPGRAALYRLIGTQARRFVLVGAPRLGGGDRFAVCGDRGRIVVTGTSNAVLLAGANTYLKRMANVGITWNGDALPRLPDRLPAPDRPISESTPFAHRFAGNDTMPGYTGPHWTFADWQRELDVLAANGINEVLVYPGQAAVYQRVFARFGYTEDELLEWIPQPAHQPWWLLQNMSGFNPPLSRQLAARQVRLGRQIADAARALGITPVFPGYYGTVPPGFAERNPGARTVPQGGWVGFTRPDWLDPRVPHFAAIAEEFYRVQENLFGPSTMYKMDLLHEGGNPGDVPVAEAASLVQAALDRAHPDATWAILGWQTNPTPELLSGVDKDRMLVLDGLSDRYTGLDRETSWGGTPYAYGSIWNFGGHTALGANLTTWATDLPAWAAKPNSALAGIAIMPEANRNNPAALAYLAELAWHPDGLDPATWSRDYARWRYGGTDRHATAAWDTLARTAYAMPAGQWSEAADGLFGAQPSLTARSAASWSPQELRYDPAEFATALRELLAVHPRLRGTSAYRHDLVDVARQVLDNHSRALLPEIAAAYERGDRPAFRELTGRWLDLMSLEDDLLATDRHFLLGPWLAQARADGADDAERARLSYDVRILLTSWGERAGHQEGLHDYANRSWQGLLGDLYRTRWQTYFASLDTALATGNPPAEIDWYAVNDAWARDQGGYPTVPHGDAHALAARVEAELDSR
jgi:Alpha-N-acetylglucosaminidase (NAGLU) tim-barrel domain/Alpha-N-acetylglucosaminidase (NAGLU) C-terminal domain/Alpha-N-acetylglucosaminidase (NAGLU) N-terminal domain